MKGDDGILALLQDIKEMLFGIALLLSGIAPCLIGAAVNGGVGVLLSIVGLVVVVAGLGYVHHGYTQHEVVEKRD